MALLVTNFSKGGAAILGKEIKKVNKICGKRLETILSEKGWKQKELAEALHMTPPTINDIIKGRANLTRDNADRVIKLFPEYNLSWLLGIDDPVSLLLGQDDDYYKYAVKEEDKETLLLKATFKSVRKEHVTAELKALSNLCKFAGYKTECDGETLFVITSTGNRLSFPIESLREIQEDAKAFLDYRLKKLVEKGR